MQNPSNDRHKTGSAWYWLLAIPFIGALWVPFYNSVAPAVWGIPFFYWFQLLWVLVTAVIVAIVYFMTERT